MSRQVILLRKDDSHHFSASKHQFQTSDFGQSPYRLRARGDMMRRGFLLYPSETYMTSRVQSLLIQAPTILFTGRFQERTTLMLSTTCLRCSCSATGLPAQS